MTAEESKISNYEFIKENFSLKEINIGKDILENIETYNCNEFIKNDFEYISITRIPYEDEIYIEHSDQINFLTCHYTDFNYILNGNILDIKIKKVCESSNVFPNISILLNFDTDSLEYILSNILKETID